MIDLFCYEYKKIQQGCPLLSDAERLVDMERVISCAKGRGGRKRQFKRHSSPAV
jgi:hypothetical protein